MIAVEIQVNGQPVATCGANAVRQLVAMVAARGLADFVSSGNGPVAGARSPIPCSPRPYAVPYLSATILLRIVLQRPVARRRLGGRSA